MSMGIGLIELVILAVIGLGVIGAIVATLFAVSMANRRKFRDDRYSDLTPCPACDAAVPSGVVSCPDCGKAVPGAKA